MLIMVEHCSTPMPIVAALHPRPLCAGSSTHPLPLYLHYTLNLFVVLAAWHALQKPLIAIQPQPLAT